MAEESMRGCQAHQKATTRLVLSGRSSLHPVLCGQKWAQFWGQCLRSKVRSLGGVSGRRTGGSGKSHPMEAMRSVTSSVTVTGRQLPQTKGQGMVPEGRFQLNTRKGENAIPLSACRVVRQLTQPSQEPSPPSMRDPGSAGAVRPPWRRVLQQRQRTTRVAGPQTSGSPSNSLGRPSPGSVFVLGK